MIYAVRINKNENYGKSKTFQLNFFLKWIYFNYSFKKLENKETRTVRKNIVKWWEHMGMIREFW